MNSLAESNTVDKRKLSRESILLLWLDFGFALAIALSNLFLSIYLWRLTKSWLINGAYHVSSFLFIILGFIIGGWLSKKKDRLITLRLGIALMAVFFLTLLIFQERVASFPLAFGMIYGLATGFYWIAMLVLGYDVTTEENRLRYFGWQAGVAALAGILGPLAAGNIIGWFPGLTGYLVIFSLSLIIFILIIAGSFFIRLEAKYSQRFLLSFVFRRPFRERAWKKHFFGWFVLGMREGLLLFLPPILLYNLVEKENIVGLLTVLFGVINIMASHLLGRYGKSKNNSLYTLWSVVGVILTTVPLLYQVNIASVVLLLVGNAFFTPVMRISYQSCLYDLINDLRGSRKLKTESMIARQIFLNLGRVLTVVLFVVYVVGMDNNDIARVLVAVSLTQVFLYLMMKPARCKD